MNFASSPRDHAHLDGGAALITSPNLGDEDENNDADEMLFDEAVD